MPFNKCTGIEWGKEWWYGFFNSIESTSILEGLTSLAPFCIVLSNALSQYAAYLPHSVLKKI